MKHNNTYYILRHGHSVPNEQKLIVSSLKEGTRPEYGLSQKGIPQVAEAGARMAKMLEAATTAASSDSKIVVATSPFTRTVETAEALHNALANHPTASARLLRDGPIVEVDLRERFFGDFEKQSDANYECVWERDLKSAHAQFKRCESVASVWGRVRTVVGSYEKMAREIGAKLHVVFVAHGDILQIAETGFRGLPLTQHRSLKHLSQAEFRNVSAVRGSHASLKKSKL